MDGGSVSFHLCKGNNRKHVMSSMDKSGCNEFPREKLHEK